jgi:hypothetical protein
VIRLAAFAGWVAARGMERLVHLPDGDIGEIARRIVG